MNKRNVIMECIAVIMFVTAGAVYLYCARPDDNALVFETGQPTAYEAESVAAQGEISDKNVEEKQSDDIAVTKPEEHEARTSGINGLVNINTADAQQLMTLPGIGESKAAAIIEYRKQNGAFAATEDIMRVKGIKEGVFSKISDMITVE